MRCGVWADWLHWRRIHPDIAMQGKWVFGTHLSENERSADIDYVKQSFRKKERGKAIFQSKEQENEEVLLAFCRTNLVPLHFSVTATLPYSEAISGIQRTAKQAVMLVVFTVAVLVMALLSIFYQMRESALSRAEQRHLKELNDMLMDISNRQNQLHQKENLQAVGVFSSGIAHEFSNLLTPIMACCEMLMLKHHDDVELYDSLLEIYTSASDTRMLARQLLSFSRSSKPGDSVRMPIDMNVLLNNCIRHICIQVKDPVQVNLNLPDEPLYVLGNQSMLHQAIHNLCVNACQSMEHSGTLTVYYERISAQDILSAFMGDDPPFIGDGVRLVIEDDGCGMDEKTLEQIFDPFFTTKKGNSGTGLGLMIVKHIINRHDGWIDVSSRVGEGSCFSVYLPEYVQAQKETADCEKRVMVVCPKHSENRALYRKLRDDGYVLDYFTDSLEAVRCFAEHVSRYALVVTEYDLESFSGIALSRTLRRIRPDFPVILMTRLIHPSQMVFDPVSAPNVVLLMSGNYQEFKKSVDQWYLREDGGGQP